jgi:hypothetical protein
MSYDNKSENPPLTSEEKQPDLVGIPQGAETPAPEQKTALPSRLWSIVPGLVILLSTLIYINYDRNFIQCLENEGEQCRKLDGSLISRVDDPMDISNANKRISETNPVLSNTNTKIDSLTNQIIETKSSITNTSQQLAKAKKEKHEADALQLTNSKASLDEVLAAQTSEMESLTRTRVVLTDGGVCDNLGLETAWKRYETILVSDPPLPRPNRDWGGTLSGCYSSSATKLEIYDDNSSNLTGRSCGRELTGQFALI